MGKIKMNGQISCNSHPPHAGTHAETVCDMGIPEIHITPPHADGTMAQLAIAM
jgi:hypothetical protein